VRFEAVYAVGHLKATQFGDRVESALRDEDVVVRRYAAGALAELRSTRHLKALRAALCDSDDMVRDRAKRAILLIEDPKLDPDTLR
jgi:HEAT repeat protein